MGAFAYVALDAQGKQARGVLEGDTARHVRALLRERQLLQIGGYDAATAPLAR